MLSKIANFALLSSIQPGVLPSLVQINLMKTEVIIEPSELRASMGP
jgi:hypothetical protein